LESRKYPDNDPAGVFVPDLVTALTTTPIERPIVASNRFVTNSNSATESRLKRACPKPLPATLLVVCWPSMLIWKATCPRGIGVSPPVVERLPGARSVRSSQLRPLSGSSCNLASGRRWPSPWTRSD